MSRSKWKGPFIQADLLKKISLEQKDSLNLADFVLCTGIDDDDLETASDYDDIFIIV